MDNLLTVSLEAHHPERGHHRRYDIRLGRDLFGEWTVAVEYGRVGQCGQTLRYGGSDETALQRVVRECLRRRLSAPARLGCGYRLTELRAADGFDRAAWLPADVLAAFVSSHDATG